MSTLPSPAEQQPREYGWPIDSRPEPEPPGRSPWSILIGGLVVTIVVSAVFGYLFTWPFALMVGSFLAIMTLTVAWGAAHPPDPLA
jgi:ABC-type branched-subunit amino acid transport system permease subunit